MAIRPPLAKLAYDAVGHRDHPLDETVSTAGELMPGRLPAHLHVGTCAVVPNLGVLNSLDEIVDGKSHTTLKFTTWADIIEKDELSIHVRSPDLATIACGDVPHGS